MDHTPEQVELSARLVSLAADVGGLHHRFDSVDTRLNSFETKVVGIGTRLESLAVDTGGVNTRLGALSSDFGNMSARLDVLDARTGNLERLAEISDARFASMDSTQLNIMEKLGAIKGTCDSLNANIQALTLEVREQRRDISTIRTTDFRLIYGSMIAMGLGIVSIMAHGFKWI
jgi:chromosome segregation ATPase